VERGATRVICFPYFLAPGNHWKHDIPELMKEAAEKHPKIEWQVTNPLGLHPAMAGIMDDRIRESVGEGEISKQT
jgi:sirohydrochlorin ferrochelatase